MLQHRYLSLAGEMKSPDGPHKSLQKTSARKIRTPTKCGRVQASEGSQRTICGKATSPAIVNASAMKKGVTPRKTS